MSRKSKRPPIAGDKAKLKHMNSEVEPKKYEPFDLDKNNNLNNKTIGKKRPEINRSISLTSSYEKRNLISNTLPPSKSLDNQLTTGKKPMTFHFRNLKKFKSKLPHLQAVQPTSATSLSSANQPSPKLSSTKASSFDTTLLLQSRNSVPLNAQLAQVTTPDSINTANLLSLRPRSVSDCSNCVLRSSVHLAHRAQHEFIKVIKRDREFINTFRKLEKNVLSDDDRRVKENLTDNLKENVKENVPPNVHLNVQPSVQSNVPPNVPSNLPSNMQPNVQQNMQSNVQPDTKVSSISDQKQTTVNKIDKSKAMNKADSLGGQAGEEINDKQLTTKKAAKLNIGDVVRRFREKHKQHFPDRPPINRIKATAICIDDLVFSWCPPGLNGKQASCAITFSGLSIKPTFYWFSALVFIHF